MTSWFCLDTVSAILPIAPQATADKALGEAISHGDICFGAGYRATRLESFAKLMLFQEQQEGCRGRVRRIHLPLASYRLHARDEGDEDLFACHGKTIYKPFLKVHGVESLLPVHG